MTPEKPRHDGDALDIAVAVMRERNPTTLIFRNHVAAAIDAYLAASPATAALGSQEGERKIADLELAVKAARAAQHPCNDINASPCAWMQNAVNVQASHVRTIEALRAAAEPFAKAWVLIASQQQLAERLSLAQIAELACHELSGADFQRVARALKEHPNG